jgi:RNA polymerase sigma-70 factor (ECF subfamily)
MFQKKTLKTTELLTPGVRLWGDGSAKGFARTGRNTIESTRKQDFMDQSDLLKRCQGGDELAWEVLVRQHQGRICSIAYGYVGEHDEAMDLAQEIFIRVYKSLHTCTDPEKFLSWLTRISRNACIDQLRRQKARPPRQDIPAEDMVALASGSPTPEDDLVRSSRQKMVHRGLQRLSEINREIIVLKEIQGLPLEEISGMLDLPLGTVKSRSSRARIELARAITEMSEGPNGGPLGAEAV